MFDGCRFVTVLAALHLVFCGAVMADPDYSIVRVAIEKDSSSVAVSGRTRVDITAAVLRGLEQSQVSANELTAGPWLHLPEESLSKTHKGPRLTVYVSDYLEAGKETAYIGITPKFPFRIVAAVATELGACGISNVRLVSYDNLTGELTDLAGQEPPPGDVVNPQSNESQNSEIE